ncbi:MAG TPA: thioredoxin [Arachnia sp.]|jgi:thioredoxin 1|nr:thioredoxin [Arachnia sp.]HMR13837.1 thioredoxin [Arachnia sp.]
MATVEITKENLTETVENNGVVLLDFWAEWCAPCRMFGPVFERVSEKYPDAVFGKVNTEQQRELAAGFEINSIPTLMALRDGVIVFAQPGALREKEFVEVVEAVLALDMEEVREAIAAQNAR